MILECVFLLGVITGLAASLIIFLFISHEERKAKKEFDERQEKYKKMC